MSSKLRRFWRWYNRPPISWGETLLWVAGFCWVLAGVCWCLE